jgi:CBS domain-containing protein
VVTITPEMSIADACQMMWEKNIGSDVVVNEDEFCGMMTDRDVAMKVIREPRDPQPTMVREIMTAEAPYDR